MRFSLDDVNEYTRSHYVFHMIGLLIFLLVASLPAAANDMPLISSLTNPPDKNQDSNVIYDEAKVPSYDLPSLLTSAEGRPIKTPEEWYLVRRPQLMGLFANLIYGAVPSPPSPIRTTSEILKTDDGFLNGRATRKTIRLRLENDNGSAEMILQAYTPHHPIPNRANNGSALIRNAVPAFLQLSFSNTREDGYDIDPARPEHLRNGVPIGALLAHGYGYAAVYQGDLVRHNEVEFSSGIAPLFYRKGQSFPKTSEWGVIAMVAWSASRAMDYLATNSDFDAKRIAILGHSKMGKAALWAAAQDTRFALVIAAQSGCGGAALWRRKYGETLEKMVTRFPYWLCRNAGKFVNNEDDLPIDQHELLACIAPRPLYVCSAIEDKWADPSGQYLSCYYAGEAYRILGKKGLESPQSPPPGEAIVHSDIGYHLREGGHSIDKFDWERFLDFADYHLQKR